MKQLFATILFFLIFQLANTQVGTVVDGWTVITPSIDSKVIYVSSNTGDDNNTGLSEEQAVKTITKAASLVRSGYPDQILLKCGDVWGYEGLGRFKSGRSATEPMVISYYGDSITRPEINLTSSFINLNGGSLYNVAIIGIKFYASVHDPNSPDYSSASKRTTFSFIGDVENILIEDCVSSYSQIAAFDNTASKYFQNINLRRNIAIHSWAEDTYTIHESYNRTQGMYASEVDGLLIEENFFDHNGWNEEVPNAGPNMFCHNIYLQGNTKNVIVKDNIIARGAAHGLQLRGGGICENNLFLLNAVNVNVGYHYDEMPEMIEWASNAENTHVSNNVILKTRYMDSTSIGYPRTSARIGVGSIAIPCYVDNNIVAHSLNTGGSAISDYEDSNDFGGEVTKTNNTIYKFYSRTNIDENETQDPGWLDPDRGIETYHQHIGKEASIDTFLTEVAKRPLHTWWEEYSSDSINNYIRFGFSSNLDTEAPVAPTKIEVSSLSDVSAILKWNYGWDNVRTLGYNIYVDGVKINSDIIEGYTYEITELTASSDYEVYLKSVDVGGNISEDSIKIQISTLEQDLTSPTSPETLQVTNITGNSAKVLWSIATDNYYIAGYNIYVDDELLNQDILKDTIYNLTGLDNGKSYTVIVRAVDGAGNLSDNTGGIEFYTTDTEDPTIPQNVLFMPGNQSISASWDESTDNLYLLGYIVYLDNDSIIFTTQLSTTIEGLVSGEEYVVSVSAIDSSGNESRISKPQTILLSGSSVITNNASNIKVYPTIATNSLNIKTPGKLERIRIVNISGEIIIEKNNIDVITSKYSIDLSSLKSGVYLLNIKYDKKEISNHIFKKQ